MTSQLEFRLTLQHCSEEDALFAAEVITQSLGFPMRTEYHPYTRALEMSLLYDDTAVEPLDLPIMETLQSDVLKLRADLHEKLHFNCDITCSLSERTEQTHKTIAAGGSIFGQAKPPRSKKPKGRVVITDSSDLF